MTTGSGSAGPCGQLVIVGTPIGNLEDISARARRVLAESDIVACEDTRRTGLMLRRIEIVAKRLLLVNEHTEAQASLHVIDLLESGLTIALVTDGGMPCVSDPGSRLVDAVSIAGHRVTVVPGPSSPVAALALSGFPAERFVFEGFIPRKGAGRDAVLEELSGERRPVVIFESPKRVGRTIADLTRTCGGDRRAVVVRELTKLHEEVVRGTLSELAQWATGDIRGEVVLVLGPTEGTGPSDAEITDAIEAELSKGVSMSVAARAVALGLGVSRSRAYSLALDAKS